MQKNAIFFIELAQGHDLSYSEYCYKSWEWWARKHGVEMLVLRDPLLDPKIMPATWQRYRLFEILEENSLEFDQIAMIDIDTMVRWDCPDFFDLTENRFTSVLDNCSVGWMTRAIEGYQPLFSETDLNWWEFFFAGFVIVNPEHRDFFQKVSDFYMDHFLELNQIQISLNKGTDITPINFLRKQERVPATFLSPHFHLCSLAQKNVLDKLKFIEHAFSWHFNGFSKTDRLEVMRATWKKVNGHYIGDTPGIEGEVNMLSAQRVIPGDELDTLRNLYQIEFPKIRYPVKKGSNAKHRARSLLRKMGFSR